MLSLLLLSVAAAGGGCPAGGCAGGPAPLAPPCQVVVHGLPYFMECLGYAYHECGGVIAPHLMALHAGPTISPPEEQLWRAYLGELPLDDREELQEVWERADFEGRRKLLGLLFQLRKKQQEENLPAGPLTREEQDRWDAHLKTLKPEQRKKAEEDWSKADGRGRRKLLQALPK